MWQFIAAIAVSLLFTFALRPKPQSQPRPTIDDIEAPTAEEGMAIPRVFGCEEVYPNVVWYANLRTVAIKSDGSKK